MLLNSCHSEQGPRRGIWGEVHAVSGPCQSSTTATKARGQATRNTASKTASSPIQASSGSAFCRQGGLAFGIQAKEFEGSIRDVLDREAGLLGGPPAARLLKDARLLGKPILFIVDGYNECGEDRRGLLTRAIAALVAKV